MTRIPFDGKPKPKRSMRVPFTPHVVSEPDVHPAVRLQTPEFEQGCAGKLCHPTEAAAEAYVAERGWSRSQARVYWCRLCGQWHLTRLGRARGSDDA